MNDAIYYALQDTLNNNSIFTVFQPIISLKDGTILGFEALTRSNVTQFKDPSVLFDAAKKFNMLWEIEYLCRKKAIETFSTQNNETYLFLNVDPRVIHDKKFKEGFTAEFLHYYDINPNKVVFEITERSISEDTSLFVEAIEHYKRQSYNIAIDDTGSGYSGLNLITNVHPKFLKLDMHLIRNIDKDNLKHALVKALNKFCESTNILMIAEGIETVHELNALIDIGVQYGQGYFIQRPNERIGEVSTEIKDNILSGNNKKILNVTGTCNIGDIAIEYKAVSLSDKSSQVDSQFREDNTLYSIPVVENVHTKGLISRNSFYSTISGRYGYEIFMKRPVSLVMDNDPLIVDYYSDIIDVANLAMSRNVDKLYNSIIVEKNGSYYGVVSINNLLNKFIDLQVELAKNTNPLTKLPGNTTIQNLLSDILKSDEQHTLLYVDIDRFKNFNDEYGTIKGDEFICLVAQCIQKSANEFPNHYVFTGHVGGDDYIVIAEKQIALLLAKRILKTFDIEKNVYLKNNKVSDDYSYYEVFNDTTLSIAMVEADSDKFLSPKDISQCAAKVKKVCKSIKGNCIVQNKELL